MSDLPKHLIRPSLLPSEATLHVKHPLNPKSDVRMTQLSDMAGLQRVGVNLARIPPGAESFLPHAHAVQEEWVYVLSGSGQAQIGAAEYAIGPGDFLGFPTDGTVHHIRNTGDVDLLLLQGGERGRLELATFPTIGKQMLVAGEQQAQFFPIASADTLPFSAWIASDPAKDAGR